jgi:membrane-associated HD superfamily phosphohydrolase
MYLRHLELTNVFDAVTGLNQRGAPVSLALILLSVVVLAGLFVFALYAKTTHKAPDDFSNTFGTMSVVYPLSLSVVAIVWIAASAMNYLSGISHGVQFNTDMVFAILSVFSAVSVMIFAIEVYKDPRRKIVKSWIIAPILFTTFWLGMMYRENVTNPVLLSYAYYALAIIFSVLSFYYLSGFIFHKPSLGKLIFTSFSSIYFCFVTIADSHNVWIRLILIAIIIYNLVHISMLIKFLMRKVEKLKE